MKILILLIILAVVMLAVAILVSRVLKKVERVSQSLFGVKSLVEGLNNQADELSETPKSISGMTRIYEPAIQKDFPEFNWVEFKEKAEQLLILAFAAISNADETGLSNATETFRQQIKVQIEENKRQQLTERYENVQIHNTEISKYEKEAGKCIITLQSAVGHIHYKEKNGKVIEGSRERKIQTKYNTQLMYIQNAEEANLDKTIGATCPNCGAPVTSLGEKKCEYCGAEVVPINIQVWSIQNFYEVDYQKV